MSADGVSVSLQNGVIVATRGFGFDLMTADAIETLDALKTKAKSAVRVHRYLDGDNRLIAQSYVCTFRFPTPNTATESCSSTQRHFENEYEFDQGDRVIGTRQWVSAHIGMIKLQILN